MLSLIPKNAILIDFREFHEFYNFHIRMEAPRSVHSFFMPDGVENLCELITRLLEDPNHATIHTITITPQHNPDYIFVNVERLLHATRPRNHQ